MEYNAYAPWLKENGYTIADLPLTANNEYGEDVIIDAFTKNGKTIWHLTTLQANGRTRINFYYEDGTITELYE